LNLKTRKIFTILVCALILLCALSLTVALPDIAEAKGKSAGNKLGHVTLSPSASQYTGDSGAGSAISTAGPISITNQKYPQDLVRVISGYKEEVISVQINNNIVGRDLKVIVICNLDMIDIKVEVIGNRVGRNLVVQVHGNSIDKNAGKDIRISINGNQIGQDLKVGIRDNWVKRDMYVNVLDNLVGRDIIVKVEPANIVVNMIVDVSRNIAYNEMDVKVNSNIIEGALTLFVKENKVSIELIVTANYNKHTPGWPKLFDKMTIEIIDNHVSKRDLRITISSTVMSLSKSKADIKIKKNGAGRTIFILITRNQAANGNKISQMFVEVEKNSADKYIKIRVENNKVIQLTMKILNNRAYNKVPMLSIQCEARLTKAGNLKYDSQSLADGDGDGLANEYEVMVGTDPTNKDTDNDGLYDGWDDRDGDKKWSPGERHGEIGDPRQKRGMHNKGGISTLFNKPNEEPRPLCRDLYVEVDYMAGHTLPKASRTLVVAAFSKQNIRLHIDFGWSIGIDNSGKGGQRLTHTTPFWAFRHSGTNNDFYDLKEINFNYKRSGIFHYTIICHSFQEIPTTTGISPSMSGVTDADDMVIADHNVVKNARQLKTNVNTARAGILMHELGHNLGLVPVVYAGIDHAQTFPMANNYDQRLYSTYTSLMNYKYTLTGPVDYSDGRKGIDYYGNADFNDWASVDLARIHNRWDVYEG
jgi:hypothetical protein